MNSTEQTGEHELRYFFDASLDNLCIAGFDGYFKRLNPSWEKTLGFTLQELMSVPYLSLVHPEDEDTTRQEAGKLSEGTECIWFENRYRCKDGSYKRLQWKANVVPERNVIYAAARDITLQHEVECRLRETSRMQRAIIDSANLIIISTRPDGIIQTFNAGALRELGYESDDVIDKVTPALIHDPGEVGRRAAELSAELGHEVTADFEAFVAKARFGQADENEWTYIRRDGTRFPVMLSVTALRDEQGQITGFLGVGRNITERKLAEAAKLAAEERMQTILDNSPAVAFMKDLDGRYIVINRRFEQLFHISRRDITGKKDDEVFPVDFARAFAANDRQVAEAGEARLFEEEAPHDEGPHSYITVKFPLKNAEGKSYAVCGLATDITEIKRAQQALHEREMRLRAVLDNAMEGIITAGDDLCIQSFNRAAVRMFGYDAEEIIGQSVKRLLPGQSEGQDTNDGISWWEQAAAETDGHPREVNGIHKDGTVFPVELAVSVTHVSGSAIYTCIVHDITERRKMEEDLRRSNQDLEQFAYIASHDLKEPLRMISSYLQLLGRRHGDQLEPDARQYIGFAVDGALRLRRLIDDLLEFSRVGTRGREFQPVDTGLVLEQVLSALQLAISEAGVEVILGKMPAVAGDPVQLGQLFQNLIANAVKFRSEKKPRIEVGACRDGDFWEFSLRDNGIGIEDKFFEKVFIIFQRLHSREKYEGTGIGLALCKKIVERHGGSIWLKSKPGVGTTFFFTLPALQGESTQGCEGSKL